MSLDLFTEAAKRDAALAQVEANGGDWASLCLIEMREFRNNPRYHQDYPNGFTASHIRSWIAPLLGNPHHYNAWGALIQKFIKDDLIQEIGFSRTGAHCRKQTVYRWVS